MTMTNITQGTQKQKSAIWYLLIVCLTAGFLTWWWFAQRIEKLDTQIELHEGH